MSSKMVPKGVPYRNFFFIPWMIAWRNHRGIFGLTSKDLYLKNPNFLRFLKEYLQNVLMEFMKKFSGNYRTVPKSRISAGICRWISIAQSGTFSEQIYEEIAEAAQARFPQGSLELKEFVKEIYSWRYL